MHQYTMIVPFSHIEVKAVYGSTRRRFLVKVETDIIYQNLKHQIEILFNFASSPANRHSQQQQQQQQEPFRIEYEDDEGDFITVSSEEELLMAIQVQQRMNNRQSSLSPSSSSSSSSTSSSSLSSPAISYPLLRLTISDRSVNKSSSSSSTAAAAATTTTTAAALLSNGPSPSTITTPTITTSVTTAPASSSSPISGAVTGQKSSPSSPVVSSPLTTISSPPPSSSSSVIEQQQQNNVHSHHPQYHGHPNHHHHYHPGNRHHYNHHSPHHHHHHPHYLSSPHHRFHHNHHHHPHHHHHHHGHDHHSPYSEFETFENNSLLNDTASPSTSSSTASSSTTTINNNNNNNKSQHKRSNSVSSDTDSTTSDTDSVMTSVTNYDISTEDVQSGIVTDEHTCSTILSGTTSTMTDASLHYRRMPYYSPNSSFHSGQMNGGGVGSGSSADLSKVCDVATPPLLNHQGKQSNTMSSEQQYNGNENSITVGEPMKKLKQSEENEDYLSMDDMSISSSESSTNRRNRKKKLAKKARIQAKKEEKERRMEQKKLEQLEKEKQKLQKRIEKELKKEEMKIAKEQKRLEKELIKTDDYDMTKNWPQNIKYVYLDGNNMLFICSTFRKYSCKRNTRHNTELLLNAIALEFHNKSNLLVTQVCYDKTANTSALIGFEKSFTSTSAIPDFKSADDQIVSIAMQHKQLKMLDYCMFVTSDKELRKRLKDINAKVASPGAWLRCVYKTMTLWDKTIPSNLDEWTDSFITKLDIPAYSSTTPDTVLTPSSVNDLES